MAGDTIIKELLKHYKNPGPWSKIMRPLRWLIGLMCVFALIALRLDSSAIVFIILSSFLGLAMTSYLFTYFYLLFNDPGSLI